MHEGSVPVCRETQVVGTVEWRTQQEQDVDLQSVLQWVEGGQRPPWDEVAGSSAARGWRGYVLVPLEVSKKKTSCANSDQ